MTDLIQLFATLVIGLFAGSLLMEGAILVPYWRRMAPDNFFRLHSTLGPHLFRYFAPLTVLAVGLSVVAAVAFGLANTFRLGAAGLCLAALAIFFIYFRKANASFADHSLKADDLQTELTRWMSWHWIRTVMVIMAFGLSIAGHT